MDTREGTAAASAGGCWDRSGGWYTRLDTLVQGSATYDYEGTLTDAGVRPGVSYLGPLQSDVEFGANWQTVRYLGTSIATGGPCSYFET